MLLNKIVDIIVRNRVRLTFIIILPLLVDIIYYKKFHSICDIYGKIGICVMLCGVLLRSWAAGIIHKGKTLATTGPYAFTRHPLYTGSFLIAIGICIITKDNTLIWLLFGIIFMIYLLKIYCEELTLADRFGKEWHEYTNTVAMFLPKRLPLRLHASWSLSQWIQNREYCVCITCVVVLVIFEILHRF